jgi:hypothetical protein
MPEYIVTRRTVETSIVDALNEEQAEKVALSQDDWDTDDVELETEEN